jgi:hypothetical protein
MPDVQHVAEAAQARVLPRLQARRRAQVLVLVQVLAQARMSTAMTRVRCPAIVVVGGASS